jgi:hypothetical protein
MLDSVAAAINDGQMPSPTPSPTPTPNPTPTATPTPTSTPTPTPAPLPNPFPELPPLPWLGRIAISSDGNEHDCDDITATAMTLALLAKTGNASRLVYYGHSDHIWSTGLDGTCNGGNREEEMRISSEETARLWGGFDLGVFINARAQTLEAVLALVAQINASSAEDPLWIIGAGPMEVIGTALSTSNPLKRQFVTVVSHSDWNNSHAELPGYGSWNFIELQTILGANIRQINDQNAGLQTHESYYSWLEHSSDPRLNWLWQRHQRSGLSPVFDPSDAGMIYWLITGGNNGGDQNATPAKLKALLESSSTPPPSPTPNPTPTLTIDRFTLVTAPAGVPILNITDGMSINRSALQTGALSIEIVTSPAIAGSVGIIFDNQSYIENVVPYSLAGDFNGFFVPANLSVGSHTLIATPFSEPNLSGTAGAGRTLTFTIVDNPSPPLPPPPANHSLSLNGLLQYLNVASSPSLNVTGAITVEAWIKTNSVNDQLGILERYGQWPFDDGGYALRLNASGRLQFFTLRNNWDWDVVTGSTVLTVGVWHHIAGVFDGTQLRVYLDGVLIGSKASTFAPISGTTPLRIGSRGDDGAHSFNGLIDEARITAGVVYIDNFVPQTQLGAIEGTRGLWNFDGPGISDNSGNGNHCSWVGTPIFSNDVPP